MFFQFVYLEFFLIGTIVPNSQNDIQIVQMPLWLKEEFLALYSYANFRKEESFELGVNVHIG